MQHQQNENATYRITYTVMTMQARIYGPYVLDVQCDGSPLEVERLATQQAESIHSGPVLKVQIDSVTKM